MWRKKRNNNKKKKKEKEGRTSGHENRFRESSARFLRVVPQFSLSLSFPFFVAAREEGKGGKKKIPFAAIGSYLTSLDIA